MSGRATEPAIFSTIVPDSLIRFKYSGGSTPGRVRTVRVASWFWAWGERQGQGEGYLQAYDSDGVFKTYHYSKMSLLYVCSTPEQESAPEPKITTTNSVSNWTSWIKQGDIIEFTYMDQTQIRNVTFVNFMDRYSSTKRKIMCYENGFTKTFFIDKMTIHKISGVEKDSSDEDFDSSPRVVQNEIVESESKKDILIKQMKAHIDSQNIMIEKFKKRMFLLEEDCVHLEEDKRKAYTIMTIHKRRYPSTWESDFVPKEFSGWEVINPPTSH